MAVRYLDYPLGFDGAGRAAVAPPDDHVRDMIEQVLFTDPGERVNRPDFGCGLRQLVFMPNSDVLAAATQFMVRGALSRWLGDVIEVREVRVAAEEERLLVDVVYLRLDTGDEREDSFASPAAGV
jgi:phage baseplate assembly protein W